MEHLSWTASEYMLSTECENHLAQKNKHIQNVKWIYECTIVQDILKCEKLFNLPGRKKDQKRNMLRNHLAEDTSNFVELSDHLMLNFRKLVFGKIFFE